MLISTHCRTLPVRSLLGDPSWVVQVEGEVRQNRCSGSPRFTNFDVQSHVSPVPAFWETPVGRCRWKTRHVKVGVLGVPGSPISMRNYAPHPIPAFWETPVGQCRRKTRCVEVGVLGVPGSPILTHNYAPRPIPAFWETPVGRCRWRAMCMRLACTSILGVPSWLAQAENKLCIAVQCSGSSQFASLDAWLVAPPNQPSGRPSWPAGELGSAPNTVFWEAPVRFIGCRIELPHLTGLLGGPS